MSRIAACSLGLFALGAACGGGQPTTAQIDVSEKPAESEVSVQVISHSFRDAAIYMFVGSNRHRLGIATGNRTTVFSIPWREFTSNSSVILAADPIGQVDRGASGAVDVRSDQFTVKPGNTVVWTLQSHVGTSEGDEAVGQSNVTVY